ncbi:YybH family protein [Usitatibacter palustris]|uniref:SnoaL-like domain-containing protein n=1 Tax=Usitatibacter palustris TaxID=2732487 RepID=A0A6M4HBA2_9PROT|nr:nuclear transport factor 2 family protein [Usitatibacter palustris]QJR15754.1 hypothetical protein DSM104440_02580 [Usitatibacter palustris]
MPRRKSNLFPTPDDAEAAFYDAFERGDLAAMMAVWAEGDDVVCVHPQGPRLLGFDAVRDSWTQIFASGMQLRVRTVEARQYQGQTIAVHSVVELLSAPGEQSASPPVSATNVYVLTEEGWRMTLHHASPSSDGQPVVEEPPPEPHTLH